MRMLHKTRPRLKHYVEAKTLFALFFYAAAGAGTALWAEDSPRGGHSPRLDEVFPMLKSRALVCSIEARIVEEENEIAWQASDSKVTISGRPVSLKLAGDNLVIALLFTPYIQTGRENRRGTLVVQGQIWVNKDDGSMHYQSVMQSIPVSFGEKVYFFPLGARKDRSERSIEILVELQPYSETQDSAE